MCPYVVVHQKKLLMNLYLLLQQCPLILIPLTQIVCEMVSKWLYNYCFAGCRFVGCFFKDLLKTVNSILEYFSSTFFSKRFARLVWFLCLMAYQPCVLLDSKWCNHTIALTQLQLGRIALLFYQIWFLYDCSSVNYSTRFTYAYSDIAFSRWDITAEL